MKKIIVSLSVVMLILVVAFVGYKLNSPDNTITFALSAGFLSSLVSSMVFATIGYFIVNEPKTKREEFRELLKELKDRELKGVKTINEKYSFNPEYWKKLLAESKQNFDLLGHALTTWCEQPYKKDFAEKIVEIIKKNGNVRIVVLHPDGNGHARRFDAINKSYKEKIEKTISFIKEKILTKLPVTKKQNLEVRWLKDLDMPYMMIRTNSHVVVSPYLAKSDSKNHLLISFDISSKYANIYTTDFDRIFESAEKIDWEYKF